jgi:hypothetical protein
LDEQEQETLSFEKTLVQPSQIHKNNEESKGVASVLKPEPHSAKMERFTSLEVQKAYRTNFSRKNVLREREVSIIHLSNIALAFIKEIFRKRKWEKLTKGAPGPCMEIMREFYLLESSFLLESGFFGKWIPEK